MYTIDKMDQFHVSKDYQTLCATRSQNLYRYQRNKLRNNEMILFFAVCVSDDHISIFSRVWCNIPTLMILIPNSAYAEIGNF